MIAPSPSRVVCEGLGLRPGHKGIPAPENIICRACGTPVAAGDPVFVWRPSNTTFTDWQYLVHHEHDLICRWCHPFTINDLMRETQKCVVAAGATPGAWSLADDAARVWLLTNPPEPPFVAVISDSRKQHLVWRAAVTLDRDLLMVQLGRSTLRIDRPLALAAAEWAAEAARIMREQGVKVTPNHPFAFLDRERASTRHAVLDRKAVTQAERLARDGDHRLAELLERLTSLGEGELWALSCLAVAKRKTPEAERLRIDQ